jgi:VTC domain
MGIQIVTEFPGNKRPMHTEFEAGRAVSSNNDQPAGHESPPANGEVSLQPINAGSGDGDSLLSPALVPWKRGEAAAYELKFLLTEGEAQRVESRLSGSLVRDPYALPELDHAYPIATVYCDTPNFDVFHGVGSLRRRKFRLRMYGTGTEVCLERKTKAGQRVRKKRSIVAAADLPHLSDFQVQDDWSGAWFHRQLLNRRLNPVCCVQYLRTAYVGQGLEGPIRLTFDRDLSGQASREWLPVIDAPPIPFLEGKVVCEFKFRGALPALFKSAIQEFQLAPTGNSKYRQCLVAAAVCAPRNLPNA